MKQLTGKQKKEEKGAKDGLLLLFVIIGMILSLGVSVVLLLFNLLIGHVVELPTMIGVQLVLGELWNSSIICY